MSLPIFSCKCFEVGFTHQFVIEISAKDSDTAEALLKKLRPSYGKMDDFKATGDSVDGDPRILSIKEK